MFNLTLSSEFGNTGKLILHSYCTSVLWSIDKKGYLLTSITCPYRGLRCQPIEVDHFFEVIRWQVTSFQMIAGCKFYLFDFIWNMLCLCAAPLKFWFQTDLGRDYSASFDFSHHSHALVTLFVQCLYSDWSKFDRWVHTENLCIILKLVYFDSWSWQSFVSTCVVFNCLFPLDV